MTCYFLYIFINGDDMEELKYRVQNVKGLIKRNRTNEYLREMLKNHHNLFVQGINGSGKTYAIYSLIDDYYKDRYIYLHLDQRDNDRDVFHNSLEKAFSYASLDLNHLKIEKPYLLVLDQFECIHQQNIYDILTYFLSYHSQQLYVIILSRQPLPESFYSLIQYHHLTLVDKCPLFFDKNETVRLSKMLHVQNSEPYLLWQQSYGWPLIVSYVCLHDIVYHQDDFVINDFFKKMTLSSSIIELVKLIALAPYMTVSLLKTLNIHDLMKNLTYLCQISLVIQENDQLSLIPVYKQYMIQEYKDDYQSILKKVYPYYKEHHYIFDILVYDYYLDKDALMNHLQQYDDIICLKGDLSQIEKIIHLFPENDNPSIIYIHGYYAYLKSMTDQYKEMIQRLDNLQSYTKMFNLMYLSCDYNLFDLLEKKNKDIPFYNILTNQASYLNGQRDLSSLIYLKYKEKKVYESYLSLFNEKEKMKLELAAIEYLFYIDKPHLCLEQLDHFLLENRELSSDMIIVLATLYFKIYYLLGLKESAKNFYDIYRNKIKNNRNDYRYNHYMDQYDIYCACLFNNQEVVYDWYRFIKLEEDVNHENCFTYYLIARTHFMMKRYDQAFYYFSQLENYYRKEKRIIDLSECLFAIGVILLACQYEERAKHYVIEAFTLAGQYRYVFPFVTYGQYGLELLKLYRKLMKEEENDKKSYENSLLQKSYLRYIIIIIRESERINKLYPVLETTHNDLTVKEMSVLKCIVNGYTNKEIAEELFISIPTVKTHVSNIYSKFGVKNRTQAIHFAKENHIIE